jgi:DNA-binding CsgD family transcriptional regulator
MQHQPQLTKRERQILKGIASGKKTREIAASFGTRKDTVSQQRKLLFSKIGVRSSRELVAVAKANGWTKARTLPKKEATVTPREHEILLMAASGLKIKETATALGIGCKTVETHLYRVRLKLGSPKAAKWQLAEVAGLVSDGAPGAPQLER